MKMESQKRQEHMLFLATETSSSREPALQDPARYDRKQELHSRSVSHAPVPRFQRNLARHLSLTNDWAMVTNHGLLTGLPRLRTNRFHRGPPGGDVTTYLSDEDEDDEDWDDEDEEWDDEDEEWDDEDEEWDDEDEEWEDDDDDRTGTTTGPMMRTRK